VRPRSTAEASEFAILPPEGTSFTTTLGRLNVALSADGRQLAFVAVGADGASRLWVQPIGSLAARPLANTDGAVYPFWSPDGRSLGFFARGQLLRIDAAGGSAQVLADAPMPLGGTWSRAGMIVYAAGFGPLLAISASGGTPMKVTKMREGTIAHMGPNLLPDGRHFTYQAFAGPSAVNIEVGSLDASDAKPLVAGGNSLYAEPGYLLFEAGTSLMAQRFDPATLALSGDPVPLFEGSSAAAADNGEIVYQKSGESRTQLVWVDRSGRTLGIAAPPGEYGNIALSSDSTRVAFDRHATASAPDVWILDLQRGVTSRLTFAKTFAGNPLWSPDGRYIAFASREDLGFNIYRRASNLTGPDEPVLKLDAQTAMFPSDWSADGKYLTYYLETPRGKLDEWVLPVGGGEPMELLHEPYAESQGQFSPDGKWLAYVSDESGSPQVYVQSFPALGAKSQISNAGGTQPRWARDGKELYYLAPDGKLMAAAVSAEGTFEVRGTEALFATTLDTTASRQTYAVAPDGRFLLNARVSTSNAPLTLVLNWPALLKK
jgi:Tol biopolymer transport system component